MKINKLFYMYKTIKWTLIFILIVFSYLIYSSVYFDISRKELEDKYATGVSQFLELKDGSRIHYRDEGNKDRPTIFLLHGFNSSLFGYEKMIPFLSKEFRLISFDFPAFGLTGAIPSKDYTIENYIKIVNQLKSHLSIDKFYLVGHSMGGHVSWRYTLEHPEHVAGLILIASGGIGTSEDLENFKNSDDAPFVWKILNSKIAGQLLLYFTPKFFAEQGLKTSVVDQDLVTNEWIDEFHDLVLLEGSREAIGSIFLSNPNIFENPKKLVDIKTPTLIIHGEEDSLVEVENSKYYVANIPNIEIKIYSNIGHWPIYEDPQRTSNDILSFIK